MASNHQDEQRLALFIDFENIAIGVRDAHYRKFDINLVLERLLEKGKVLVKKAYADWSRYSDYKRSFHEAAIELIEVPQKSVGGKNSADIRLVVDAWLKLHPGEQARARSFLQGFVPHLGEACIGSISEIFDAEAPYTPRGCVAQAWSVAEVLRCWIKTR